ncbi:hypothetical protein GLYMA_16G047950v4 [Glycine max]|nr:hypothetical protein GLYMA_16G047950v4 [Glycine max]KAH1150007.1 hypothetical protein GYH30_044166 [Glycine max]
MIGMIFSVTCVLLAFNLCYKMQTCMHFYQSMEIIFVYVTVRDQ